MWIGLLGTLDVRVRGEQVPITAGKQRVVLAALAVRLGQAVGDDMIAEAVWDGSPPATWRVTLRNYVVRLRALLGEPEGRSIVTVRSGYLLSPVVAEVDLSAFEAQCRAGHKAAAGSDWAAASAALGSALALWRGDPFADVASQYLRDRLLSYLQEARVAALAARIGADLRLLPCRAGALVPELRLLCSEHPLHERFRAQLMTALYRSGRQAEALASYREARRIAIKELGVEPGTELASLHDRILCGDPVLLAQLAGDWFSAA